MPSFAPTSPLSGKGKSMNFMDIPDSFNKPIIGNPIVEEELINMKLMRPNEVILVEIGNEFDTLNLAYRKIIKVRSTIYSSFIHIFI